MRKVEEGRQQAVHPGQTGISGHCSDGPFKTCRTPDLQAAWTTLRISSASESVLCPDGQLAGSAYQPLPDAAPVAPPLSQECCLQWPSYRCLRRWRRSPHEGPSRYRDGPVTALRCSDKRPHLSGRLAQWALTIAWAPGWMQDESLSHDPPSNDSILLQPWTGCKLSSRYIT